MNKKNVKVILFVLGLYFTLNVVTAVFAVEKERDILEFVKEFESTNQKVAYLTFDDGPSIYTHDLLDVLNQHEVPGIFFVLGKQIEYVPNSDEILKRMLDEGHHIALHTMTHDKFALYHSEKSPNVFKNEMLELKEEIRQRTGHVTNLCRAPFGKENHFKLAHHKVVEDTGLYCIDWHVDSKDWEKTSADQIYNEVQHQLKEVRKDQSEIVLLFHEYERTVEVMPRIIALLRKEGYRFEAYVEGKVFEGLK